MLCSYLFFDNLYVSPEPREQLCLEGAEHVGQGFQVITTPQVAGVTEALSQLTCSASISCFHTLDDQVSNGEIQLTGYSAAAALHCHPERKQNQHNVMIAHITVHYRQQDLRWIGGILRQREREKRMRE